MCNSLLNRMMRFHKLTKPLSTHLFVRSTDANLGPLVKEGTVETIMVALGTYENDADVHTHGIATLRLLSKSGTLQQPAFAASLNPQSTSPRTVASPAGARPTTAEARSVAADQNVEAVMKQIEKR